MDGPNFVGLHWQISPARLAPKLERFLGRADSAAVLEALPGLRPEGGGHGLLELARRRRGEDHPRRFAFRGPAGAQGHRRMGARQISEVLQAPSHGGTHELIVDAGGEEDLLHLLEPVAGQCEAPAGIHLCHPCLHEGALPGEVIEDPLHVVRHLDVDGIRQGLDHGLAAVKLPSGDGSVGDVVLIHSGDQSPDGEPHLPGHQGRSCVAQSACGNHKVQLSAFAGLEEV